MNHCEISVATPDPNTPQPNPRINSRSIAFGDGGNDVDMLRFAGIGVAMGNATDEPKTVADYVTDSVDDAGISNALHHFEIL